MRRGLVRRVKDVAGGVLFFVGVLVAFWALGSVTAGASPWQPLIGICIAVGLWVTASYLIKLEGEKVRWWN